MPIRKKKAKCFENSFTIVKKGSPRSEETFSCLHTYGAQEEMGCKTPDGTLQSWGLLRMDD